MPTRSEVQKMYDELGTWQAVGEALGVNKAVAYRYATEPTWEPKRPDLRGKLGLPRIEKIEHLRLDDGTFGSKRGG